MVFYPLKQILESVDLIVWANMVISLSMFSLPNSILLDLSSINSFKFFLSVGDILASVSSRVMRKTLPV